ncbi:Uncharacterized protein dnm_065710 [Desulfonema magnum]|uniref:Uncharacterized protein n=1 Tax=Desulfonema magnum TaxID=45655 RepID=A0A975GR31_9BACT|nr:Uncharacterized protein dnm_065710 [Desulfonema magnum]
MSSANMTFLSDPATVFLKCFVEKRPDVGHIVSAKQATT